MKKTITIGGEPMEFEASAMTDHMYDKIFGGNLTYIMSHLENNQDKAPDIIRKMAFVMAKRAELGGWKKVEDLTLEDFYNWLDDIDSYELESEDVSQELLAVYSNNKMTTVNPKKANSPQAES